MIYSFLIWKKERKKGIAGDVAVLVCLNTGTSWYFMTYHLLTRNLPAAQSTTLDTVAATVAKDTSVQSAAVSLVKAASAASGAYWTSAPKVSSQDLSSFPYYFSRFKLIHCRPYIVQTCSGFFCKYSKGVWIMCCLPLQYWAKMFAV